MQTLSTLLARADRQRLETLAGDDAVKLLRAFIGPLSEAALAALIVNMRGVHECLKDEGIRNFAFDQLTEAEAKTICDLVLKVDTGTPMHTVRQVDFQQNATYMSRLLSYFGEGEAPVPDALDDKSEYITPTNDLTRVQREAYCLLRDGLSDRKVDILLQMPFGCGKRFVAVHAIIDLLRSSREGEGILWLCDDAVTCDDVYEPLRDLWGAVGTRDINFSRAYGSYKISNFPNLRNAVIVADARSFVSSVDMDQLRQFAPMIRAIVVDDGLATIGTVLGNVVADLRTAGAGNILGISPAPASLLKTAGLEAEVWKRFPKVITSSDASIGSIRWQAPRYEKGINVSVLPSGLSGSIKFTDQPTDVEIAALASDFARNEELIKLVRSEVRAGRGVALYSSTEDQARTLVGVLTANGVIAVLLTASMNRKQRDRQLLKFAGQSDAKVICIHGVPISGGEFSKLSTAVLASPTSSFAELGRIVGRFLSESESTAPAKLIFVDDGYSPFTLSAEHIKYWDNLECNGEF